VLRLGGQGPASGSIAGWAAPLGAGEHSIVLLCGAEPARFSQGVFADVLAGLAKVVSASASRRQP
jgi:hypothetical protein